MFEKIRQTINELQACLKDPVDIGKVRKCAWELDAFLRTDDSLSKITDPKLSNQITSLIARFLTIPNIGGAEQKEFASLKEKLEKILKFETNARKTLSLSQSITIITNLEHLPPSLRDLNLSPELTKNILEGFLLIPCLFVDDLTKKVGYIHHLSVDIQRRRDGARGKVKFTGLISPPFIEITEKRGNSTTIRKTLPSRLKASAEKAIKSSDSFIQNLIKELKLPEEDASKLESYDIAIALDTFEEVDGASIGLPVALATLSRFLDIPFLRKITSTGVIEDLGGLAKVAKVDGLQAKIKTAMDHGLYEIIVPQENFTEIKDEDWFKNIEKIVKVHPVEYLTDAINIAFDYERVKVRIMERLVVPAHHKPLLDKSKVVSVPQSNGSTSTMKWLKAGIILTILILLSIPAIISIKYVAKPRIFPSYVQSPQKEIGSKTDFNDHKEGTEKIKEQQLLKSKEPSISDKKETAEIKKSKEQQIPMSGTPIAKDVKERKEIAVSDEHRLAMARKPPEINEKEKRLNELKPLINRNISTYQGKPNVAIVIEAKSTEKGISHEEKMYNFLKSDRANIIYNLFKEKLFKSEGFFGEIYEGNTEILTQVDALSGVNYLILGRLNYSFRKGAAIDKELVSCDINFSYKVISKNAEVIKVDSINVIGPGFSEDAALTKGLEIISEKYFNNLMKSIL